MLDDFHPLFASLQPWVYPQNPLEKHAPVQAIFVHLGGRQGEECWWSVGDTGSFFPINIFAEIWSALGEFVNIKEVIQGVMENSSLSLDPDAPSCRGNQLALLLKETLGIRAGRKLGPDCQGTGLKSCRGGSAEKGKLRSWGSLPPGSDGLSSLPEFSKPS